MRTRPAFDAPSSLRRGGFVLAAALAASAFAQTDRTAGSTAWRRRCGRFAPSSSRAATPASRWWSSRRGPTPRWRRCKAGSISRTRPSAPFPGQVEVLIARSGGGQAPERQRPRRRDRASRRGEGPGGSAVPLARRRPSRAGAAASTDCRDQRTNPRRLGSGAGAPVRSEARSRPRRRNWPAATTQAPATRSTPIFQQYGSSPHAPGRPTILLGESYYVRSLYGDATTAYARALKDWPKTDLGAGRDGEALPRLGLHQPRGSGLRGARRIRQAGMGRRRHQGGEGPRGHDRRRRQVPKLTDVPALEAVASWTAGSTGT